MLPIAGLLTTLLLAAPVSATAMEAYLAAWRGDLDEARTLVTAALARDPRDGAALMVAACLEIEEGHLDAAAVQAGRLAALEPPPPEAAVLRALIERRRGDTFEPMEEALAGAWKAAGRPDLGRHGLLRTVREAIPAGLGAIPPIDPGELRRRPEAEALLLSPLASPLRLEWASARPTGDLLESHRQWMASQAARALALAGAPDANPVALNVCVYRWLDDAWSRQQIIAALARAQPDNGALDLAALLDPAADLLPLTAADLDAIDLATAKPEFAWPYQELHAELVRALRPLDGAHAALRAKELLGWCAPASLAPFKLARRAEATRDPALRGRAVFAAEAVGRRLGAAGTLLDVSVGWALRGTAARLRGDPEADALLEQAERWRERVEAAEASAAIRAWPLPATWRQWAPGREVRFLERLADAPLPP